MLPKLRMQDNSSSVHVPEKPCVLQAIPAQSTRQLKRELSKYNVPAASFSDDERPLRGVPKATAGKRAGSNCKKGAGAGPTLTEALLMCQISSRSRTEMTVSMQVLPQHQRPGAPHHKCAKYASACYLA